MVKYSVEPLESVGKHDTVVALRKAFVNSKKVGKDQWYRIVVWRKDGSSDYVGFIGRINGDNYYAKGTAFGKSPAYLIDKNGKVGN